MKMNISLLADGLSQHFSLQKRISRHRKLTLNHPSRYLPEMEFLNGGVYIAISNELPDTPHLPEECAVISIGCAPVSYTCGDCDYVELPKDSDVNLVLNCLQNTYDLYDDWYQKVQSCIIDEKSLQEMMDVSLPIFVNPIFCCDFQYNIAAYAEYPALVDPPQIYSSEIERMEMVNDLKLNEKFQESFSTTEPTLWQDNTFSFDSIYCNVFIKSEYWGKVMVDARCRPFQESDYVLLGVLQQQVQTALKKREIFSNDAFRALEHHLQNILDGNVVDSYHLQRDLESLRWEKYHSFFCVLIRMEDRDVIAKSLLACCRLVEQKLIHCRAFPYHEHAVIIVPAEAWDHKTKYFCSKLSPILRDGLYKASVSGLFHNFLDFRQYYSQAMMAMEMGQKSHSMKWIYYYEDYTLEYMLEKCIGDLAPELLLHPKLLELMEYDQRNNLEYVKTLQFYVENNCSQAQTCREMFLHRSTLLQRLARIQQLTGFNLDNDDTRLYLRLVFRVIALQNNP